MESKCLTCKNAKIDEIWGDLKCTHYNRIIPDPYNVFDCGGYTKDKTVVFDRNYEEDEDDE